MSGPIEVDPRQICWWAEAVDGLRENEDVLIVASEGRLSIRRASEPALMGEQQVAVVRRTAHNGSRPERLRPAISYSVPGGGAQLALPTLDGVACDAIFVTPSAAAKFVYPYYEAHRLLTDAEMVALKQCFTDSASDLVGIAHYPPSRPAAVGSDNTLTRLSGQALETAYLVRSTKAGPAITSLSAFAAEQVAQAAAASRK